MAQNPYQGFGEESSRQYVVITPSDTVDLPTPIRKIYVGGAGAVAIMGGDGVAATLAAVPVGTVLNVSPKRVMATNTTATLLIGLV